MSAPDPYLDWTQATGWQGHSAVLSAGGGLNAAAAVPVLIELKVAPADLSALGIVTSGLVLVPGLYRNVAPAKAARYCTATVLLKDLAALAVHPEVERFEMALPLAAGPVDVQYPNLDSAPAGAEGEIVIGIIDRGFAFLNTVFRAGSPGSPGQDKTRIAALWDQGRPVPAPQPVPLVAGWHRPAGVGYGRELLAADIDKLIGALGPGSNEARLYRDLDYLVDRNVPNHPPVLERVHGTHVADTVAGLVTKPSPSASAKPAREDKAQLCKILAVNIPGLAPDDTTGASSGVFLLDAIRYILHRAGPGTRVVINVSIGIHGGPHDGSSMIDEAVTEVLGLRDDMAVTVAGGNAANERWSTTGALPPGGAAARVLRLMPNDRTDSFLEVWWDASSAAPGTMPLTIQVEPPTGLPSTGRLSAGDATALCHAASGLPAFSVTHVARSALGRGPMALISIAPTAGPRAAALPGRWTIHLRNVGSTEVFFDAWIQRDEPPLGTDDPIQPSFDDFEDAREGEGCALSDLGCSDAVIAVGAAHEVDGQEAGYSGRKRSGRPSSRPGVRADVDLLASADESRQAIGLFASAVQSEQVFRMGGTSVAAPVAARLLIDLWADPTRPLARTGDPASLPPAIIKDRFLAWAGRAAPPASRAGPPSGPPGGPRAPLPLPPWVRP